MVKRVVPRGRTDFEVAGGNVRFVRELAAFPSLLFLRSRLGGGGIGTSARINHGEHSLLASRGRLVRNSARLARLISSKDITSFD